MTSTYCNSVSHGSSKSQVLTRCDVWMQSECVSYLSRSSALFGEAFEELGLDQAIWPLFIMKVQR